MLPDEGQVIVPSGEDLEVLVTDDTFVLIGCDEEVGRDAIQAGMDVMIIGKIGTDGVFKAATVLLRPLEVKGMLVSIESGAEGSLLTVQTYPEEGDPVDVAIFLPLNVYPHIKGDGLIPLEMLTGLLACHSLPVEIKLDPENIMTAADLAVLPMKVNGMVKEVLDPDQGLILVDVDDQDDDINILVPFYATLLYMDGGNVLTSIQFEDIKAGDQIISFGLEDCGEEGELDRQIAFMLAVVETVIEEE